MQIFVKEQFSLPEKVQKTAFKSSLTYCKWLIKDVVNQNKLVKDQMVSGSDAL